MTIRSKGPSSRKKDVMLQLEHTPEGAEESDPYDMELEVRAPKKLNPLGVKDSPEKGGYESIFEYTLKDNFDDPIPYMDYNEDFGAEVWDNESAEKIIKLPEREKGSGMTDGAATLNDHFQLYGPPEEMAEVDPPITTPQEPLSTAKILHFWQKWYIGTSVTGEGVLVQTNTGQFYADHARHEDIKSPPAKAGP